MCNSNILSRFFGISTRSWADAVMVKFIDNCDNYDSNHNHNHYDTSTIVRNISSSLLSSYKTDHIDDPIPPCFSVIPTVIINKIIIIIIIITIFIIIITKATINAYNDASYFFCNDNDYCPFKPGEPSILLASMLLSYRRYHHRHY